MMIQELHLGGKKKKKGWSGVYVIILPCQRKSMFGQELSAFFKSINSSFVRVFFSVGFSPQFHAIYIEF